ncbi:MAG: AbrB/MazE/SpoVT family DNA-binding domain-containing protein [Candidatus Jordarchaeales archaeon]
MEYKAKISRKGQVVIPKEIREKYGYREGVEVTFRPIDETRLLIERTPRISELFGFLEGAEATKVLLEEREKELKGGGEDQREKELLRRGSG